MAKVAITEQYLTDIADAIRSKTGLSNTFLPAEMAPAILTISGSGGITPTGTLSITANGTYNVTQYASASVNVPVGSTINNQNKTVTPTELSQSVTYDSGYTGLGTVTVGAISDTYVGSAIDVNPTPTVSGATVTIPVGYYNAQTTKSVASGTAGTPSASKGTVSNHSISITPSVTNTTGYITGSTKTGTAVTVSASELVSGTLSVTSNGTKDVTNYASINVNISGDAPVLQDKSYTVSGAGTSTITPDSGYDAMSSVALSVPSAVVRVGLGEEYSTVSGQRKWNASPQAYAETAGWFDSFSPVTDTMAFNAVPANTTITPSTSAQTIGGTGYHMEGAVTVAAMPTGTAGTPTATKGTVSNHSISVTPSVTNTTGYITGSTKTGTAISVSASELVSGNKAITANGTNIDVTNYATVSVAVPTGESSPTISSLTVTPSESEQTFNSSSVDGYKPVTVSAISSTYVGSGISTGTIVGLTSEGTHNSNYYILNFTQIDGDPFYSANGQVQAYVPRALMGSATTAQVLAGATFTSSAGIAIEGTIETKDSDDLTVSGATVSVPAGYYSAAASKSVASGTATAPTSISGTAASVSTGTNTLTLTKTVSVTPRVTTAGYVSSGTAGNSSVSLTASVTVDPTPTASGATVTIPAGYYTEQTTKSVSSGSATGPTSLSGSSATITTGTNTLTLTKTGVTTTPTVSAGYVSSATASTATVTLTASVTTKAAATITPTTTNQTIASGTYLTGTQTIAGDADLVGSNILSTTNIFGVQGTVVVQNYYTGSSAPSSSLGSNGDLYLQS